MAADMAAPSTGTDDDRARGSKVEPPIPSTGGEDDWSGKGPVVLVYTRPQNTQIRAPMFAQSYSVITTLQAPKCGTYRQAGHVRTDYDGRQCRRCVVFMDSHLHQAVTWKDSQWMVITCA